MKLGVALLCGLLLLSGCARRGFLAGGQKIRVQLQAGGKVFLNPDQGDVLTWVGPRNQALVASFPHGTPCKEGSQTPTCTINVASGYYYYTCPGCTDPGIAVGSSNPISVLDFKPRQTAAQAVSSFIYCENDTTVAAERVTASVGDTIQWFGSGPITNWTVTVAPNTCGEGTTLSAASPVCTVISGAASNTYQVQTSMCRVPNGSSYITIR